ncbi:MAG: S-methyl-5-thioribose-1-phosphate isomerase [Gammaproteobacteria bacterium]|nr:S-methyl-5-thioribose-1-phosphate isomerase [Gammaproteobacteria bacterium]
MTRAPADTIRPIAWREARLWLLDQRGLPGEERYLDYTDCADVATAIRDMVVRGAPAIGVAAAYACVLAARRRHAEDPAGWRTAFVADLESLAEARPTAVNLRWAVARMRRAVPEEGDPVPGLLAEAQAMQAEDIAANHAMGRLGAPLIDGGAVLTHCNAGALATAGFGTALGVIRQAHADGRLAHVYADETRPWLQGARLTAWELAHDGIPTTLLCEGAAAALMREGRVGWVVVGADRVAANGDTANKIGTYALAVLARHHGVRFMVVAPTSTIDREAPDGAAIPIEQRGADEVLGYAGRVTAATGVGAWNPAFDVTPAALIDALVTERGVVSPPGREAIAALFD